jgi:xylose isomerase
MSRFKFSAGPWNVSEGGDAFGPEVRETIPFDKKVERFKKIGLNGVQFHDDDAVPDMNSLNDNQIVNAAKDVKAVLDSNNLEAEFVAPRLWMDPHTIDGGFTSNSKEDREFALWRSLRSVDIARALGSDRIVLWLAREGTLCYESKDPIIAIQRVIDGVNAILEYDKSIRVLIEPKPNEPIDRSFYPTLGHVMAMAYKTSDPDRVGGLLESAHAILAGLDPANEIAFGLAHNKLWSVHLNDQNGMKYDQDKAFGAENLRQAFNQVRVLVDNDYGKKGEFIGVDVKAMRTTKIVDSYKHIENSIAVVKMLEKKVGKFNKAFQHKCMDSRDYEALEMYVLELLMGE